MGMSNRAMKRYSSAYHDYYVWVRLRQAAHAATEARKEELRQTGLSVMEAAVLFIINTTGRKATLSEVARWLFRQPNSTSELISRMEKKGLVTKVRDLDKISQVRIALTEKGEELYRKTSYRESVRQIISHLSQKEQQELVQYLERLLEAALMKLGKDSIPPTPLAAAFEIEARDRISGKDC